MIEKCDFKAKIISIKSVYDISRNALLKMQLH